MIVLEGHGQRAQVEPRGAALVGWAAGGRERLSALAPDHPSWGFDGVVMMPWPNRARGELGLPVNEPERGTALHGLVHDVEWEVVERDATCVRLRIEVGPAPGYPHRLSGEAHYRLDAGGLVGELTAVNTGGAPAPFGCGAHPYLAVHADRMRLDLPARRHVPVDDRGLPTGPPEPVAAIGSVLDTCFTELDRDADGIARVRADDVVVWFDAAFGFVQIYTGDRDPDPERRRTRIGIEPMTCAPDAFTTGLGLRHLAPGERFAGRWGLTRHQETT